ncbi:flavin monoamine oxidase family protein [Flavihumibacter rivuli]|uniref:flavin monoamine oxidase family protein n=1 Tax=Flavihumibacter rivuli TaxID=2838156 RepID=UPI001BDE8C1A|nr:flavin monoamine oxidase family protein [Flavihumibacter rivuli]ULQ56477.1 flavin monoamine oxidase family protein [Flavihumibacter rivuli]
MLDVIIIGAGYSGLSAARDLLDAGKDFLVLEARDRVGGRIHSQALENGTYIDLGGQWIGPGHDNMYALCREFNIETFATHDKGKSTLYYDGKRKNYRGLIPPLPLFTLLSLNKGIQGINKLARKIECSQPWAMKEANQFDQITVAEWMERTMKKEIARNMFRTAFEAIFAADPEDISLLHALFYVRSNNNFDYLMNIRKGAQQDRIKGGAQLPAIKLAATLGERLKLNHPVTSISQDNEKVTVTGAGFSFEAKKLIVAIPPVVARDINYQFPLTEKRKLLMDQQFMGAVVKCYAIYNKPFWREKGLNGLCAAPSELTSVVFDNSPADGSKGILMGFSLAKQARQLMALNETDRRTAILDCFSRYLGEEARNAELYIDKSFTDETWTKGCYAGMMPTGAWTSIADLLSKPEGHIHWAGTETATQWNGYMEGAILAGKRAAREIIDCLK